jgi:hypothetical protein
LDGPRPTTKPDEHDHSVETPVHSSHKHSWTTYGSVAAGISVFILVSAASVLCFQAKKMGTVRPWATGLSGQLQKAFVTGMFSPAYVYYDIWGTILILHCIFRCTFIETI